MNQRFARYSTTTTLLWSRTIPHPPRGLALAREKNCLLVWDAESWLYLIDHSGDIQGQTRLPFSILSACASDTGDVFIATGRNGDVFWLAPDFSVKRHVQLKAMPTAIALEPYGRYLAVADQRSSVQVYNWLGEVVFRVGVPRSLHHLAFVPEKPLLIGAADYGLVGGIDAKGKIIWRDGLVAYIGSLAVTGDGSQIVCACFSEGIQRYSADGKKLGQMAVTGPCRRAAIAYNGTTILAATLDHTLDFRTSSGKQSGTYRPESPLVGHVLTPLADQAYLALADRRIVALAIRQPSSES
ncbi:MAG: hypothetical protein KatS3mg105_3595 [Gemmatales bacterium]|nr:MAG: hypothetical protein KatS3mg105_3595 [Gemmatales bacterium]